ncbi:MAG: polysaccharide pyruvyl transferase family protein, partial [Thermoanaerobacterium sp.]|nr:polysaccharide pyruvyl transferase family protein [Thermoanaerobacterium sp.]
KQIYDERKHAYRHITKATTDLQVIEPSYQSPQGSKLKFVIKSLKLWFNIFLRRSHSHNTLPDIKAIRESDLIVCKGGHILHTGGFKNRLGSLLAMLHYAYWPYVASLYNKKIIFFGHSFGPYLTTIDKKIAGFLLKKADFVFVRESLSKNLVLELGVTDNRVKLIPDLAFVLNGDYSQRVKALLKEFNLASKEFAIITLRTWTVNQKKFLNEIADLLTKLLEKKFVKKVAIVVHTLGPIEDEDDSKVSEELYALLKSLDEVILINEDLSPEELIALYGEAKILIGTRFHSVIFASIAGTPAYAISYAGPKAEGIMRMQDLGHLVQHISLFSAEKAFNDIIRQDYFLWVDQVKESVKHLKDELDSLPVILHSLLEEEKHA